MLVGVMIYWRAMWALADVLAPPPFIPAPSPRPVQEEEGEVRRQSPSASPPPSLARLEHGSAGSNKSLHRRSPAAVGVGGGVVVGGGGAGGGRDVSNAWDGPCPFCTAGAAAAGAAGNGSSPASSANAVVGPSLVTPRFGGGGVGDRDLRSGAGGRGGGKGTAEAVVESPKPPQPKPVPIPTYIEEEEEETVTLGGEVQSDDEGWVSDDGQPGGKNVIWTSSPGREGGGGGGGGDGGGSGSVNWDQSNKERRAVDSGETDPNIKGPVKFGVGRGGGSSTLHAAPRAIRSWSAGGIWRGEGGKDTIGGVAVHGADILAPSHGGAREEYEHDGEGEEEEEEEDEDEQEGGGAGQDAETGSDYLGQLPPVDEGDERAEDSSDFDSESDAGRGAQHLQYQGRSPRGRGISPRGRSSLGERGSLPGERTGVSIARAAHGADGGGGTPEAEERPLTADEYIVKR